MAIGKVQNGARVEPNGKLENIMFTVLSSRIEMYHDLGMQCEIDVEAGRNSYQALVNVFDSERHFVCRWQ